MGSALTTVESTGANLVLLDPPLTFARDVRLPSLDSRSSAVVGASRNVAFWPEGLWSMSSSDPKKPFGVVGHLLQNGRSRLQGRRCIRRIEVSARKGARQEVYFLGFRYGRISLIVASNRAIYFRNV